MNEQLHVVLIAHKDLKLYAAESNGKNKDAFSKIEGRLSKRNLTRTFDEDMSLIYGAKNIKDKDLYNKALRNHLKASKDFYDAVQRCELFKEYDYETIKKLSFPFNPFALYALVYFSKIAGQNERTLFTFLNDSERYSFSDFISSCDYPSVLNTDCIYDYFDDLLINQVQYQKIIMNVRSVILTGGMSDLSISVLKALAVIRVMDSPYFKPTRNNIALSLFLVSADDRVKLHETVNELIKTGYINESILDKTLDFKTLLSFQMDNAVKKEIRRISTSADISKSFTDIIERKYIVSAEYNYKYKMTRYAEVVVLKSSVLKAMLNNKADLLSLTSADALVVLVINDDKLNEEELYNIQKAYLSFATVLLFAKQELPADFYNKFLMLTACSTLTQSDKLSDVEKSILINHAASIKRELNIFIEQTYFCDLKRTVKKLCLSLENYYGKTIIFNNEMVNRHTFSKTTITALKKVIDVVLYQQSSDFSPSSQEATIYKAYIRCIDVIKNSKDNVIDEICKIFINNKNRVDALSLVALLCKKDYGMREGVAALIIATAIFELVGSTPRNTKTIILYYKNKEIDLVSDNILKVIYNPSDYFFEYKCVSQELIDIVKTLEKALCVTGNNATVMLNRYATVLGQNIQKKIYSLQNTVIQTSLKENVLKLSDVTIAFKNLFLELNINFYELIFKKLFDVIGHTASVAVKNIEIIKNELYSSVTAYEKEIIERVKLTFAPRGAASIKTAFEMFENTVKRDVYNFTNITDDALLKVFKHCTYNDKQTLNELLSVSVHTTTDDINKQKEDLFFECIAHFMRSVENDSSVKEGNHTSLSPVANTLKNNLTRMISSYGLSITDSEKVDILNTLILEIKNK